MNKCLKWTYLSFLSELISLDREWSDLTLFSTCPVTMLVFRSNCITPIHNEFRTYNTRWQSVSLRFTKNNDKSTQLHNENDLNSVKNAECTFFSNHDFFHFLFIQIYMSICCSHFCGMSWIALAWFSSRDVSFIRNRFIVRQFIIFHWSTTGKSPS